MRVDDMLHNLLRGHEDERWPTRHWFCYDYVVQDYEREGYRMPFPLSRAEFGKELSNLVYHNRGRYWLKTKRVTNNFGCRIRWYKIEPLVWFRPPRG
jgi:hypothetical protein